MRDSIASEKNETSDQQVFIQLLVSHPVLLEKCQLPANKAKKETATEFIINSL